ncbi:VapC toxin family PIN domain ribonuclease [Saccharobesus litoralis]|uniref:VapC toxin family PIN domain ribonuclease n=1 Tax=Saccharobesus litoralis TaxID=2172099 RepID=A0A2S0VSY6_9ALTE|nr:PIN domain-containing protein [Saccharobesus litoralis]AWB67292.1 VapC toxin family PIN domain ribonuclease [Saccharobesus litoralis]
MIIADSSYWLALANTRDQYHQIVLAKTVSLNDTLITTWPVLTETCHLLLSRMGVHAQVKFIQQVEQFADLFVLEPKHLIRCSQLMEQYQNLPMDLTDASLVVLAENLGEGKILSTDRRDFNAYRWNNQHPFQNVLFD